MAGLFRCCYLPGFGTKRFDLILFDELTSPQLVDLSVQIADVTHGQLHKQERQDRGGRRRENTQPYPNHVTLVIRLADRQPLSLPHANTHIHTHQRERQRVMDAKNLLTKRSDPVLESECKVSIEYTVYI